MTVVLRSPRAAELLRHGCGLLIIWMSLLPPSFEFGWLLPFHIAPSFAIALLTTVFLLLLRPRIGTVREIRGISSALTIFLTVAVWASFMLGRGDKSLLTGLIEGTRGFFSTMAGFLTGQLGEIAADLAMRPFALLLIGIVLLSFLFRSYAGFILAGILFFGWGSLPPTSGIIAGFLLWFAGFSLIARDALYLQPEEERCLKRSPRIRRLLLECRDAPVDLGRLKLLLGNTPQARDDLAFTLDQGLLTFDPAGRRLLASERLLASVAPGFIHDVTGFADRLARLLLIGAAVVYLIVPVDLLPEAALGPLGFIDDLLLLLSAFWPSLAPLLRPSVDGKCVPTQFSRPSTSQILQSLFPPPS